jgi:hypothetical protein
MFRRKKMNKTYQKTKINKASQWFLEKNIVPLNLHTQMPKTLEAHLYIKDT